MNLSFKLVRIAKLSLLALLTSCLAPLAQAADYDIWMDEYGFDPAYLEVQVGDTVYWWNLDSWGDPHTTRSYTYPWNSGLVPFGYGVYLTVIQAGTFPYIDEMTGETGTLVVNPVTPQATPGLLVDPIRSPGGQFQFTVTNLVIGQTCIIQASTNLVDWEDIYTNLVASTSFPFTNSDAPALGQRFCRAWHLP